jgi:dCTP deaminase
MIESGTLSDGEIATLRNDGLIVIDPFVPERLGANSYDVTLGEWFYREEQPLTQTPLYNLYDKYSIDRTWGKPEIAWPYVEHVKRGTLPPHMVGINETDLVFLLPPGATVLGHTVEYVGGRLHKESGIGVTTKMHCRSSMGRSLLGVCKCSGFGDVGFINRWTMEITSFSQHHWIPLVVGRPIAQIEFVLIKNCKKDYSLTGKYQSVGDLRQLQESWTPEMMLPRLHLESTKG